MENKTKIKRVRPIRWTDGCLRILDQTRLPAESVYLDLVYWSDVVEAIQALRVRGAPAIGIAGAYALALAAHDLLDLKMDEFLNQLGEIATRIIATRPTAVNLDWAVSRTLRAAHEAETPQESMGLLAAEARAIESENTVSDEKIVDHGVGLVPGGSAILTYCNTGSLATGALGTALGIIRRAWGQGKVERVVVPETRPLLQGSRLTAWELVREEIPFVVVVDGAVGYLMYQHLVTMVLVGADRIASNGDVANKIGTYPLAVLANSHNLPFYVAAPLSSVDLEAETGNDIPIEERSPEEVLSFAGQSVTPQQIGVLNPAFDITPARFISAIVTDVGVLFPPYGPKLQEAKARNA